MSKGFYWITFLAVLLVLTVSGSALAQKGRAKAKEMPIERAEPYASQGIVDSIGEDGMVINDHFFRTDGHTRYFPKKVGRGYLKQGDKVGFNAPGGKITDLYFLGRDGKKSAKDKAGRTAGKASRPKRQEIKKVDGVWTN
ncbi:MAG: hypothetical protein CSB24_05315 [Deltaproteobacteria bacterium]|nr:MAG: hypothetical protein CSB24_05315 [Deltaproteobacteria bacterium]